MPANTTHKLYDKNLANWRLVRDCVEGSQAIKSRTGSGAQKGTGNAKTLLGMAGTAYLPPPNPDDVSWENQQRYIDYRTRAVFINFTGHTVEGLCGMVFRMDPVIDIDPALEYMMWNVDGDGLSISQQSQEVVNEVIMTGRDGLLVDHPEAPAGLTKAQEEAMFLRATIQTYKAESILNWRTTTIGGVNKLSLVVLAEPTEVLEPDGFGVECKDYVRVLRLEMSDGGMVYTQELLDEDDNRVGELIIPRKADGSTFDEIPFVFVGAKNNDPVPDKSPVLDIADINIGHYRNSADLEESTYQVGQPTFTISGLTQTWVDKNMPEGILVGSRRALPLPEGATANLLQASPNQMPSQGMKDKEQQMVMIGARIIEDKGGNETAEAAKMRFAGQNSKLGLLVGNVVDAYRKCLGWASEFMAAGESEFDLNRDFYEKSADPQRITAEIMLLDRNVIAKSDLRDALRKRGVIAADRTDEEIDSEAGDVSPVE